MIRTNILLGLMALSMSVPTVMQAQETPFLPQKK